MIPDLSVLWVVFFVLLVLTALDRLILKPVTRVMREREHAIQSARKLAASVTGEAEAATAEFEKKTDAALAELYRQMEDTRRTALGRREQLLAEARGETEAMLTDATTRLKSETEQARARLRTEAEALGGEIAERILGSRPS